MDKEKTVKNTTPKSSETEDMKSIILENALTVFAENGYADTSMQDIADAAGISRGPLYYYYSNKADLFNSVFTQTTNQMEETITQIFSAPDSFFEKVEKELNTLLDIDYRRGERIREIVRSSPENHPNAYQHLINSRKVVRYIKTHSVKQAISEGELAKDADAEQIIEFIFVFHRGIISERIYWTEDEYEERVRVLSHELIEMLRLRYTSHVDVRN